MVRKPAQKRPGKVITMSVVELPSVVEDLLADVTSDGRLLTPMERKLLASRLRRYTLDADGPIHVLRIPAMDAFRFFERPDLADDEGDAAAG
ncbi:MAG TPA: hypothetical protein VML54_04475 [Candidatus Limnocylindrales bacterium]|nr:hypothetical protein [Candidatus Limnocylindrales bacterium]